MRFEWIDYNGSSTVGYSRDSRAYVRLQSGQVVTANIEVLEGKQPCLTIEVDGKEWCRSHGPTRAGLKVMAQSQLKYIMVAHGEDK